MTGRELCIFSPEGTTPIIFCKKCRRVVYYIDEHRRTEKGAYFHFSAEALAKAECGCTRPDGGDAWDAGEKAGYEPPRVRVNEDEAG